MRSLLLCFCTAAALSAQPSFEFWPGAAYDPAIPTFQKILGFEPGSRFATHADLIRYLEALSAAAPNRLKVIEYGKSWQGRKLVYAVIGSEANMRRLPEIQASMKKLLDPRKTAETDAQRLIANTPAIVWLGHAVHGNEVSGPDAGLLAAYHLLAARNQPAVTAALANTLVILDPLQNPDGRMRFIHAFEQAVGLEPDAVPLAAERNEPWPGGRLNHYLFDMNRDWFAVTQPETKARIKMFQEWYPVVVADLHEMGSETSYYFAPEAIPFNPHLTKEQKTSLDWFGKNNAKYFDQLGYPYFTREQYDAFFPGYGASWPAYYGAIAMTYENSSVRGLIYRRLDGTLYTFQAPSANTSPRKSPPPKPPPTTAHNSSKTSGNTTNPPSPKGNRNPPKPTSFPAAETPPPSINSPPCSSSKASKSSAPPPPSTAFPTAVTSSPSPNQPSASSASSSIPKSTWSLTS